MNNNPDKWPAWLQKSYETDNIIIQPVNNINSD